VKADKEASNNKATRYFTAYLLPALLFDPNEGGETFVRNVGRIPPNYIQLHP
jgi:hypothetical protein